MSLFVNLLKEQFPDVVIPTIVVQTIYVGNSPKDMENLVTRPIEKQLRGISGVKINKITSTSLQDFSAIVVEFSTSVKTDVALQKIKDAVDKSRKDLPNDSRRSPRSRRSAPLSSPSWPSTSAATTTPSSWASSPNPSRTGSRSFPRSTG